MRNLKKVLSLVLCVAMLLSVMVMGTGAAFTDQDEIQNAEAVDMTSAWASSTGTRTAASSLPKTSSVARLPR